MSPTRYDVERCKTVRLWGYSRKRLLELAKHFEGTAHLAQVPVNRRDSLALSIACREMAGAKREERDRFRRLSKLAA